MILGRTRSGWSRIFWYLSALVALSAAASAAKKPRCFAFVDVTVVPIEGPQALPHQTVLVRADRIAEVSPSGRAKVPDRCTSIDGRHRFLIPGLVDSHVHLPLAGRAD